MADLALDISATRPSRWIEGVKRGGARLRPSSDAATVRVRDGEMLVSDGPFAETKEQVGGFDIIECASLD